MANGDVEIHDPFPNHKNLITSSNCDPKSASDSDSMADTVEFRLVMAYAKRRRPKRDIESAARDRPTAPPSSPKILAKTEKGAKGKKKSKSNKGLSGIFARIKPQMKKVTAPQPPAMPIMDRKCLVLRDDETQEDNKLEDAVSRLTEIADAIPFSPPDLQSDSADDAVEKVIALLLREAGDRLNERELINAGIATELFWNYSFFETVIKTLLIRMGLMTSQPNALEPQASPRTQIAVTCEVTNRLSALDTLPMSRMLDHGARYLQVHYSSWAQQHGGYEGAFYSDDEDEEQ